MSVKYISFLLAVVVFLSSTGHVFTAHLCQTEESQCSEASNCCCEEMMAVSNCEMESSGSCCITTLNYLINPFSVRKPESQLTKIKVVATEQDVAYIVKNFELSDFSIGQIVVNDSSPPGEDIVILTSCMRI